MASRKKRPSSSEKQQQRRDRISELTDDVLGHVLSFLPNKEAGRAAALAQRWRHVFGSVHTISFEEAEGERADDWITFYYEAEERKSCSDQLLDGVNGALLCRDRCGAGFPVPLRRLSFAFDHWHVWDKVAVDQWLASALRHRRGSLPELHLDLCFRLGPICTLVDDADGGIVADSDSGDSTTEDSNSGTDDGGTEVDIVSGDSTTDDSMTEDSSSDTDDGGTKADNCSGTDNSGMESDSGSDTKGSGTEADNNCDTDNSGIEANSSSDTDDSGTEADNGSDTDDSMTEGSSSDADDGGTETHGSPYDREREESNLTYVLPGRLFSCSALRTLCLTRCRLELPAIIDMPFLQTLRLTSLLDSERSIQRLISSCPCLVDLTLEALDKLERLTILDKRLHRFALRCCHNMKSVDIDTSGLRSLHYRGTMPTESLISLHGSPLVPSLTIDLCRAPSKSKEAAFAGFARFLDKISDAKHLHLHRRSIDNGFFTSGGFPLFCNLTQLTLQGPIESCETVAAVRRVLEQTPNLESLSLLMEEHLDDPSGRLIVPEETTVPDRSSFSILCLRHRLREIGMEGYEGSKAQKMLAELLLRNALVLQRLHAVFVEGMKPSRRSRLEIQLGEWAAANSEKIFR